MDTVDIQSDDLQSDDLQSDDLESDDLQSDDLLSGDTGLRTDGDVIITGLCGRMANGLGVDTLWVRIAFVLLALLGGIGLVIYLGLWLVLVVGPEQGRPWPRALGGGVLLVGVPLILTNGGADDFLSGPFVVIALLIGLTLALWQPRQAPVSTERFTSHDHQSTRVGERTRRRRPETSLLGRGVLATAIVVAAAGWLIDQLNGGRLHPEQWMGVAVIVCGIGLLVGTVRGFSRWLIVPAAMFGLAGFVGGAMASTGVGFDDFGGDRFTSVNEFTPAGVQSVRTGIGTTYTFIDSAPAEPVVVDIRLAFGDSVITVLDGVDVEVIADLDDGVLTLDGRPAESRVRLGPGQVPNVIIEARVVHGDVRIETRSDELSSDVMQQDEFSITPVTTTLLGGFDTGGFLAADANGVSPVVEGVDITSNGSFVLFGGGAIIGPSNEILSGDFVQNGPNEVLITIDGFDAFQLVRGILITPFGDVVDLSDVRRQFMNRDAVDTGEGEPLPSVPTDPAAFTTIVPAPVQPSEG